MLTMDAVIINAKDYIDETRPVVDAARAIGDAVAKSLLAGAPVIVSVQGVRGVSSSFFNIVLLLARAAVTSSGVHAVASRPGSSEFSHSANFAGREKNKPNGFYRYQHRF